MASHLSTKEKLLLLIDDIELISKEMIETSIAPKQQRADNPTLCVSLTELLLAKQEELKSTLALAEEQAKIQQSMESLRREVDSKDNEIFQLQKQLKEAENILATSLYQARLKLANIVKSRKRPIPSEELIKFAHRISASGAISAPLSWQAGDPRRPYPTDMEMRLGFLGRLSDLPLNGINGGQMSSLNDLHRQISTPGPVPASPANQFAWLPSGELHVSLANGASVPLDTPPVPPGGGHSAHHNHPGGRNKDAGDDVEVMSTDSSSSSSSDSQ